VAVRRPRGSLPSVIPGFGVPSWSRTYYRPAYWYWRPLHWGVGYWAYYDPWAPWAWTPSPYSYGGWGRAYSETGAVRLKVRPREAQVFVDGYYVGIVDEFDGRFQRLRLEDGPHQIEVRLPGYEPLDFKVYVTLDRTLTLRGELRPAP
jgi:hypothetical protein